MKKAPDIIIQIIHIEGPLKGEVAEFARSEVTIGRHPSCQVAFPKDQTVISRFHAKIVRDGNRFKLIDQSANGTLVNGKFVTELYLKEGDVIFLTEAGPKISFLTRKPEPGEVFNSQEPPASSPSPPVPVPESPPPKAVMRKSPVEKRVAAEREQVVQETSVPLVVQYGPNLLSFKKVPVTFGRSPESDFVVDLPSISGRHGQFFFSDNSYWIKDLTGKDTIRVNGQPAGLQFKLNLEDQVQLGPEGPLFKFIGGGRLIEMDAPLDPAPSQEQPSDGAMEKSKATPPKEKKKGFFNGLFKK
jgi:pSer/pThr/pTyr-binding forkhead associated (FHA) protein